jgi:hypothetical protein
MVKASALRPLTISLQNHQTKLYDGPITAHNAVEKEKAQEGFSRRKDEIVALKVHTRDPEAQQQKNLEEEEHARPILGELYGQIIVLQEQVAPHLQRGAQAVTAGIKSKILFFEQENNHTISLLAPIRHLPAEILSEIFTLAITEYSCSALHLSHVCRSWRLVLLSVSRFWSKVKTSTWTSPEKIECLLERSRRTTLDVEIDTDSDSMACMPDSCQSYVALAILAGTSMRWRNLAVGSIPSEKQLLELEARGTSLAFNGPLESLESFRMTRPCEMNTALGNLIDLTRKVESSKLTVLEISSASALYRFAEAPSVFRLLRLFKVDLAEMKDPLDILPHFQCLEDMYIHRLHLPLYSPTTILPLTRTLKRVFLKSTSIQWMNNRTFSKLVECIIIWPHFPETLLGQSGVDLPTCTSFTYDDHLLQPLTAFNLPSVDKLIVRNEAWNRPRGGQQLGFIWGPNILTDRTLKPRVLHLDTQCYDQHLITTLKMNPGVEELILGLVRPDALGKKFLLAMLAKKGRENTHLPNNDAGESVSGTGSGPVWTANLCPKLRAFGLKYRRWLRDYENDELTPLFLKILETRSKSDTPLQSFKVWLTKDTTEQEARELVA